MLQEIENYIEIAFLSIDNEQRTQAERYLTTECYMKIEKFLLLAIMVQIPNHKYAQHATILLNTIAKKIKDNPLKGSLTHFLILQQLVANQIVRIQDRILLAEGLTNLVIADDENHQLLGLRDKLLGNIGSFLKKPKLKEIISASLFFQSVIKSMQFGTYHFIHNPPKYADWVFDFLKVTKGVMNLINNDNVDMAELFDTITILSIAVTEMCELIFNVQGKFRSSSLLFQNTILNSEAFNQFLFSIIQYNHHDMLYALFNDKETESTINKVKLAAFKCYYYILKTLVLERDAEEWTRIPFAKQVSQVTLTIAFQALNYMKSNSVNQLQEIHIQIFSYLLQILAYSSIKYVSSFSDGKVSYIIDLIYPFVVSTKQEIIDMVENPQEFVQLSLDAIDYHRSQVPKIGAINLFQNLCKHIDDAPLFFLQIIISITKQAIFEITNLQLANDFEKQIISSIKERAFFKFYTAIERIESSLVLLAALSSSLQKNIKYLIQIEDFLVQSINFFLQTDEIIIQTRLILFLGYYCIDLLKIEEAQSQYLIQYLELIVKCISNEKQVILYQAIDILVEIFDEKRILQKLSSIVPQLYDILVKTLICSKEYQHFALISKLLINYQQLFIVQPCALTNLSQVIIQRIIQEEAIIQSGNKSQYYYCSRSWALLKELLKEEFKLIIPSLDQALCPIYEQISTGQPTYFEEEFLNFINEEIQLINCITDQQFKLMNIFPLLIKNRNDRLSIIFDTLNIFLNYGRNRFLDENIQQQFFALAFQALLSEQETSTEEEKGLGAHLIQVGIELLNKDLNSNILQPIFTQLIKLLQSEEDNKLVKSRISSIFWASFYMIPEITFQILPLPFESLYEQLLQQEQNIGCDNKIRIISQCQIMMNDPHRFTSSSILNLAYLIQWQHERFYKDWDQENYYNDLIDDDEIDDLLGCEEEQRFLEYLQEDIQLLYRSSSPMLKVNEYEVFKRLFNHFKEKYPQFIELLNSQLKQNEIATINEVLSYIKIEIEQGYDESRRIIKASKQKKQKQNLNLNQKA